MVQDDISIVQPQEKNSAVLLISTMINMMGYRNRVYTYLNKNIDFVNAILKNEKKI